LRGTAHALAGETPYAQLGDWPGWLALAVVAVALTRRPTLRSGSARSAIG
jgi:apolipoprotein N-acyltransferase